MEAAGFGNPALTRQRPTHKLVSTGEQVKLIGEGQRGMRKVLLLSGPLAGSRCVVQGGLAKLKPHDSTSGGKPAERQALARAKHLELEAKTDFSVSRPGTMLDPELRASALRASRYVATRLEESWFTPASLRVPMSMVTSKESLIMNVPRPPLVLPSIRTHVVGQAAPPPLLAGWYNRPPSNASHAVARRAFLTDKRAFETAVHIYESQIEALYDLGRRWELVTSIDRRRADRERAGFATPTAADAESDLPRVRAVSSSEEAASELLETTAVTLAEFRLTLLRMVQTFKVCQERHTGIVAELEDRSSSPPSPGARGKRRKPSHLKDGVPDGAALLDGRTLQALMGPAADGRLGTSHSSPAGRGGVQPVWWGFNFVLRALTDFERLPLPTASDPFCLLWFVPEGVDNMAPQWRERFLPEEAHTDAELREMQEATAFLQGNVLGRRRHQHLSAMERSLWPQRASAGPPASAGSGEPNSGPKPAPGSEALPQGWVRLCSLLYGDARGFIARLDASDARRSAANLLVMGYRRRLFHQRCARLKEEKQHHGATRIQWYWRCRRLPGTFVRAFTRTQKRELRTELARRAHRRHISQRRMAALVSAMAEYEAYEAAVLCVQVRIRIFLGRRLLTELRHARAAFRRRLAEQGPRLVGLCVKWQRQIRRWRVSSALAWAEYKRVAQITTASRLQRALVGAKPTLATAQEKGHAHAAELRAKLSALSVGAEADFFRGLGAAAFTKGALEELMGIRDQLNAQAGESLRTAANPHTWLSRRLVDLESTTEGKEVLLVDEAREERATSQALQLYVDDRVAEDRRRHYLVGAEEAAFVHRRSAGWALVALVGSGGHLRDEALRLASETAKREVTLKVAATQAYEERRGRINAIHELLGDTSSRFTAAAMAKFVEAKMPDQTEQTEQMVAAVKPAAEAYVAREVLLAELSGADGAVHMSTALEAWSKALNYDQAMTARVSAGGVVSVSRAVKASYKRSLYTLAMAEGSHSVIARMREGLRVPPTTVTVRCCLQPGCERLTNIRPGELRAAFEGGLSADLADALNFAENQLELLDTQERDQGTTLLLRYRVRETSDPKLGHPHVLVKAVTEALEADEAKRPPLSTVADALRVEDWQAQAFFFASELPKVLELHVRRAISEDLHKAEKALAAAKATLAEARAAKAAEVRDAQAAEAVHAGALDDVAVPSASGAAGPYDDLSPADPTGPVRPLEEAMSPLKRAAAEAEGRILVLRALDKDCPPRDRLREGREWLPGALDKLEAFVEDMVVEPKRVVARVDKLYAARKGAKAQLRKAVLAVHAAFAAAAPVVPAPRLHMRPPEVSEQDSPWMSVERCADDRRLATHIGRFAVQLTRTALEHVQADANAQLGLVQSCVQLVPRPSLTTGDVRPVSPEDLLAMAEKLGCGFGRREGAKGDSTLTMPLDWCPVPPRLDTAPMSKDLFMIWVAAEAITAPLPALWREASPKQPAAYLGDWTFENVITGERIDEHPLLPVFASFVAARRSFGRAASRKFEHYDGAPLGNGMRLSPSPPTWPSPDPHRLGAVR